jgi:hypothetical protein
MGGAILYGGGGDGFTFPHSQNNTPLTGCLREAAFQGGLPPQKPAAAPEDPFNGFIFMKRNRL